MQVHALAPESVPAVAAADSSQGVVEKVDDGVLADHMPESFLIPNIPLNTTRFIKSIYSTYRLCHAYHIFTFHRDR